MNQRINELAIQSGGIWQGGYVDNHAGDGVWTEQKFVSGGDMDVEQFAELIAQECVATIVNDTANYQGEGMMAYYQGVQDAGKSIKQLFGVKE